MKERKGSASFAERRLPEHSEGAVLTGRGVQKLLERAGQRWVLAQKVSVMLYQLLKRSQ